ncbi:MAG TPA: hypothetical protein VMF50_04745 [Candidatus Binataceae bacterium]|nr:hypothetical protein [Candidatus Binataceae bacterium]
MIPNDDPELTCPTTASGSGVNLACGCILAGGDNFSPADPSSNIALTGDANLGNWSITQLEANFAYGDLDATSASTFFIGNPNGSGAGVNGGRCYGAAGFTTLVSTNGAIYPAPVLYLTLEGTICDTIPLNDPSEPQKFSFTGSYIVDPVRSSAYYSNWSGTGTFVVSMSNVSANPPQYSPSYFSFNGYLLP